MFHLFAYCSLEEVIDGVEMERALETQRANLLRLLAGWFLYVEWVSVAPFIGELPHWFRSFLGSLVTRAEFAAQNLVVASACIQAKNCFGDFRVMPSPSFAVARSGQAIPDDTPTTRGLINRMKALRALLDDLPRQGRLFLCRRETCEPDGTLPEIGVFGERLLPERRNLIDAQVVFARRIERPPDKDFRDLLSRSL